MQRRSNRFPGASSRSISPPSSFISPVRNSSHSAVSPGINAAETDREIGSVYCELCAPCVRAVGRRAPRDVARPQAAPAAARPAASTGTCRSLHASTVRSRSDRAPARDSPARCRTHASSAASVREDSAAAHVTCDVSRGRRDVGSDQRAGGWSRRLAGVSTMRLSGERARSW